MRGGGPPGAPAVPEELRGLAQALILGDRFQLCILVSPFPRATTEALRLLRGEVRRIRRDRRRWVRLGPRRKRGTARTPGPADPARLVRTVLGRLGTVGQASAPEDAVWIVDATRSPRRDEDAWAEVFRRLNERRNGLSRDLRGPLLICLPPWLEARFAHEAPDLWSVRSVVTRLRLEGFVSSIVEDELGAVWPSPSALAALLASRGAPPPSGETRGAPGAADKQQLATTLAEIGRHAAERPHDPSLASKLLAACTGLADLQRRDGGNGQDLPQLERAVEIARRLTQASPGDPIALSTLAMVHGSLGVAYSRLGETGMAIEALSVSEAAWRRLRALSSRHSILAYAYAAVALALGMAQTEAGLLPRALGTFRGAIDLVDAVPVGAPGGLERLHILVLLRRLLGDAHLALGEQAEAVVAYDAALDLLRSLGSEGGAEDRLAFAELATRRITADPRHPSRTSWDLASEALDLAEPEIDHLLPPVLGTLLTSRAAGRAMVHSDPVAALEDLERARDVIESWSPTAPADREFRASTLRTMHQILARVRPRTA